LINGKRGDTLLRTRFRTLERITGAVATPPPRLTNAGKKEAGWRGGHREYRPIWPVFYFYRSN
jgi:hypothetical protein